MRPRLALALLCVASAMPSVARADGDGVYGRFDGDLVFDAALGAGVGLTDASSAMSSSSTQVDFAPTLELRLRYLDTAGIMSALEVRPDGLSRVVLGIDLRPLFLARFFLGAMFFDRYWDIWLDSIGLDLGVALTPLDERVGAALAVGFGFDVPLVFFGESIDLLALRVSARHTASIQSDRFGPGVPVNDWFVGGAIVLRLGARLGAASWGPPAYDLPRQR
ncbi:MAG: hypothetical protein AB7S26_02835 [Sandaracinaceae bacterium]